MGTFGLMGFALFFMYAEATKRSLRGRHNDLVRQLSHYPDHADSLFDELDEVKGEIAQNKEITGFLHIAVSLVLLYDGIHWLLLK